MATYEIVETTYAQVIALFVAWRDELDSEPFAHESEWVAFESTCLHPVQPVVTETTLPSPRHGGSEV